ncbi:hypothetical protein H5410_060787 [Solanum commersonii]|uniref:DUF4283 domain-containing protein n=1 Tax=Solanum commersonii TaxID=4109 RepID=A0A9J5W602_SOLCO|nr:hypothetical protein H5410_060787 [Solanum commersonii]
MRTLKWDPLFDLEEETSIAIAWISFPSLPHNFFGKEAIFSLVDLLGEFPKRINVGMRKKTREIMEKRVQIKYNYVLKYCKDIMKMNVLSFTLNYTQRRKK